jgi:polysaccharide export outer membrane protein
MKTITSRICGLLFVSFGAFAQAQEPSALSPRPIEAAGDIRAAKPVGAGQLEQLRANYILRPGDQVVIRAFEMEEISDKPYRLDGNGRLNLPALGVVEAGGKTVERLEAALLEMLKKFVRVPQVTVSITQFSSEPVFFVGAFRAPGIYPLAGGRTLVEMISVAGGLQPTASRRIKLTRRKEFGQIPLANAVLNPEGDAYTAEINISNTSPSEDVALQPFDVISVQRAEMVYVNGEVSRVGGLELQERDSMSVIQAITLAGGLTATADGRTAVILRPVLDTSRRAGIPVNLRNILSGKEGDRFLLPNDVLYIPKESSFKRNLGRSLPYLLPVAGSALSIAIALLR